VLGFPFIFRGALDVHAKKINEEMKMAATHALADLAKQDVPDAVRTAYGVDRLHYGVDYLIPKPLDPRVLLWEAPAVAEAAMKTGVARKQIDLEKYREELEARLGYARALIRGLTARAAARPQRIVFPEGADARILRAARNLVDEKIAKPVVLGDPERIKKVARDIEIELTGIPVIDPRTADIRERYAQALYEKRQRKGMTLAAARRLIEHPHYFSSMMVAEGDADAMLGGIEQFYPDKLHAPLQAIGVDPSAKALAGVFMMVVEKNVYFVADTTVNVDPDAQTLAHIASETARLVKRLGVTPRVAFLSFSNFGGARFPATEKVAEAVRLLHESEPDLEADGEMMAETALEEKILKGSYPFSRLTGPANVLIFPGLNAGNIGYQLLKSIAKAEAIGPILIGMNKPVHILQRDIHAHDVINMAVIAAVDAQERKHWD